MQDFKNWLEESESPEYKERVRLAHYAALVRLAIYFGFSEDSVGVSLSHIQSPDHRTLSLDMQMPPELRDILQKEGLL
jgi:hypothetical protein